jgi:hypothetical protein
MLLLFENVVFCEMFGGEKWRKDEEKKMKNDDDE